MDCHLKVVLAVSVAASLACGPQVPGTESPGAPADPLAGFRMVDLTHSFDGDTVFWPTGRPFNLEETAFGPTPGGYFYSAYDFSMSEHTGTHMDAPVHFAEGKPTVGEVPLESLFGPLAVLDVREQCATDPDYAASAADLHAHEAPHGAVEQGMAVLVRTGWSERWPNTRAYLGDDTPGSADDLHFPGISEDAAQWLVDRGVGAVGIDTASIDPGNSTDFRAHRVLAAASLPILENVARLGDVPVRGAYLLAFPMKIGRGSGAPTRVVALVPALQDD